MLITNKEERMERHNEKTKAVISFLTQECYSDITTLMKVIQAPQRSIIDKLLRKLIAKGYLHKHQFSLPANNKISIWGITRQGLAYAQDLDDPINQKHFVPSKIRLSTLHHHLENQRVRLRLEQLGCFDCLNGDNKSINAKFDLKHRPDGFIKLPNDMPIAFETELIIKSRLRYIEIIKHHLVSRSRKYWYYVLYVAPDEHKKAALIRIFNSIDHVTNDGQRLTLSQEHRNVFKFCTFEELQNNGLKQLLSI